MEQFLFVVCIVDAFVENLINKDLKCKSIFACGEDPILKMQHNLR